MILVPAPTPPPNGNRTCPTDWIAFGDSCYYFQVTNINLIDAKTFCEDRKLLVVSAHPNARKIVHHTIQNVQHEIHF